MPVPEKPTNNVLNSFTRLFDTARLVDRHGQEAIRRIVVEVDRLQQRRLARVVLARDQVDTGQRAEHEAAEAAKVFHHEVLPHGWLLDHRLPGSTPGAPAVAMRISAGKHGTAAGPPGEG